MGLSFYTGEDIDLSPFVREQTLLALPLRPLCSEKCRGLCPDCGAELNRIARAGARRRGIPAWPFSATSDWTGRSAGDVGNHERPDRTEPRHARTQEKNLQQQAQQAPRP